MTNRRLPAALLGALPAGLVLGISSGVSQGLWKWLRENSTLPAVTEQLLQGPVMVVCVVAGIA